MYMKVMVMWLTGACLFCYFPDRHKIVHILYQTCSTKYLYTSNQYICNNNEKSYTV